MTQKEKLLQKLFSGQPIHFDDIYSLLLSLGYKVTVCGSHYTFRKEGQQTRITLPRHGKDIKKAYIKQLQEMLKNEP